MAGHVNFRPSRERQRVYYVVIARSDSDEAIHTSAHSMTMDCFASLARTWKELRSLFSSREDKTYLYESGSGESDGLANSFSSSGPIGTLRFKPFGGIFWLNHLS